MRRPMRRMARRIPLIRGFRKRSGQVDLRENGSDRETMRRRFLLLMGLAFSGSAIAAQSDAIFVCTDADGHKTYQNSADGPSCRRIDGIVATIPASDLPHNRAPRPIVARTGLSPASFPRVDVDTQRVRDSDRRRILEEELRSEQERLARLQAEFNHGQPRPAGDEVVGGGLYHDHVRRLFEDIERSQGNIASLRRELTPIRY
jgi:hypothetical protein